MKLTENQKENIHQHLTRDNNLEDKEVISELFDHYILAIESKEDNNSFENALNEVFWDFGGKKGLQALEDNRYKERQNIIDKMLKNTFKGYFTSSKIVFVLFLVALSFLIGNSLLMIVISCILVALANTFIIAKTSHRTLTDTFMSNKPKVISERMRNFLSLPLHVIILINPSILKLGISQIALIHSIFLGVCWFVLIGGQIIFCEVMLKYYKKNELYLK